MAAKNNIIIVIFALAAALAVCSAYAVTVNSIILSTSSGNAPINVEFTADVNGTGTYSYSWDFGDGKSSAEESPSHKYISEGSYTAELTVIDNGDNSTDTKTAKITVNPAEKPSVSVNANPTSGNAPLDVKFITAVTGNEPFSYKWDFNNDNITDSTESNPDFVYSIAGTYNVKLTVTDALGTETTQNIKISVSKYEPAIDIESYFPKSFKLNSDAAIDIIILNTGSEYLSDIETKILTEGVLFRDSTAIKSLAPNDKDMITVTFVPSKAGKQDLLLKILGKNFELPIEVLDESTMFNSTELEQKLSLLKEKLNAYEDDYMEKKAENYILGDISDSLKAVKNAIQAAKQNIAAGKLSEANTAIGFIESDLNDIESDLKDARKIKKTIADKLRENALLITAIVAALTALGSVIAQTRAKAKHLHEKVRYHLKEKFAKKVKLKKSRNGKQKKRK